MSHFPVLVRTLNLGNPRRSPANFSKRQARGPFRFNPEAPSQPVLGTGQKHSNYRVLLDPSKNARPRKNARPNPRLPSGQRQAIVSVFKLRSFAAGCLRIFALVLHFDFCSLPSATHHLGGPIRPISPVWENAKQEEVYVCHILLTTPSFAIRLS